MNEQITTIAELDALPVGSIAARICSDGQGNVAYSLTSEGWFPTWSYSLMRGASMRSVDMHHISPLTVLYRPDAPERTEPTEEQVRTLRGQLFDAGYREAELLAENKAFVEEIREAKAEAWDEGLSAAYGHVYRQGDADAAGQGVLIPSPANPYRSEADHG